MKGGNKVNEEKVISMIKHVLHLEDGIITDIYEVPGGMTNFSYFVSINDEKYIVRLAGLGTEEIIDRKAEKSNLLFGTSLGLNPALIYMDVDSGMKITRKIKNATTLTPSSAREGHTMKHIISLFLHLHHSEKPMENRFRLFDLMVHYESLVKPVNIFIIDMLAPLKQDIMELKVIYESLHVKETPCHIDSVCSNLVRSGSDKLFLIDWEYSGMFDPLWDLATLFQSFELTEEEKMFFLTHYFGREPTNVELQRILMHTIFLDYLWSLWSFYKEAQGDDLGSVGIDRFKRATENVILYRSLFQEDIVV